MRSQPTDPDIQDLEHVVIPEQHTVSTGQHLRCLRCFITRCGSIILFCFQRGGRTPLRSAMSTSKRRGISLRSPLSFFHPLSTSSITMFAKLAVAFLTLSGAAFAMPVHTLEARNLGRATYYDPNGGYGACGNTLQNTDMIVALSADQYLAGANCGKQLVATHAGKSVTVTVADLCPGCAANGLDLSSTAFSQLAALGEGNIDVDWHFV
ncbi:RlpA-like double-psi beta-barrel-protein domain-containing protein-containing protein [Schizophyllum commune]